MKQHKTLVNEVLKKYPYLKCLKPYIYYPWEWIKEKDGVLYKELTDGKEKSLDNLLALQKRPRNRSFLTSDNTLNFWYSGGERTPLYNRPRMNEGYAIFAVNRYKFIRNYC